MLKSLIFCIALCASCSSETVPPYPKADSWTPNRGPGGPTVTFDAAQLGSNCAYLDGGPRDTLDHHNLVTMYDGYLMMPWAPEFISGGITFFDIEDPCDPLTMATAVSDTMRETHSVGISHKDGAWVVVNGYGGINFFDISDTSQPLEASHLELPGFVYPDAYALVTLSVFWQGDYVYVAGADNGIYIVDASDPRQPELVAQYVPEPLFRIGQVQVIGNLLVATAAEGARAYLIDISDPTDPRPLHTFVAKNGAGVERDAYFTNTSGGYLYFALKDTPGGLIIYDIGEPTSPSLAGEVESDGAAGYVFVKDNLAFMGESEFAAIYDLTDLQNISEVSRFELVGDLDTITPIGNVVVLSVDADAKVNEGSAIAPFAEEPDTKGPTITWSFPPDGESGLAVTSRIGITASEMIDPRSGFDGSVRLFESGQPEDEGRVVGTVNVQENIINFVPDKPLRPNTDYTLRVVAGGIVDFNGNPIASDYVLQFGTGS